MLLKEEDIYIGKIVRVIGFVGVVVEIKKVSEKELILSIESPKRIALHQTTLDNLNYCLAPDFFEHATINDLLAEFEMWIGKVEERERNVHQR